MEEDMNQLLPGAFPPDTLSGQRHPDFYFFDGDIVLSVEESLFRLHRSILAGRSPVLRDILEEFEPGLVARTTKCYPGASDSQPLCLNGVKASAFAAFLSRLYPRVQEINRSWSAEEWISLLAQGRQWGCSDVITIAASQLHQLPLDPIVKIGIWKEYGLDHERLMPSFHALCLRPQSLSAAEAQVIGLEASVQLMTVREQVQTAILGHVKRTVVSRSSLAEILAGEKQLRESMTRLLVEKSGMHEWYKNGHCCNTALSA